MYFGEAPCESRFSHTPARLGSVWADQTRPE